MTAAMLSHNVVASGVSCGVSTPSEWESCVRVWLGRPGGAAALPCSSGRRISAPSSGRGRVRAAVKELCVDNDVVVLPTRNALQVHKVEKQNSDDDQTPLSKFEILLREKS